MSKAKKGGKGKGKPEKKKEGDEPEWDGPDIDKELCDKEVTELHADLNAPISVLLKEHVVFQVLIDRINDCDPA